MPTPYPMPSNSSLVPVASDLVAKDPSTGLWWQCSHATDIIACPDCQGVRLRCQSHFGYMYR